MAQPPGDGVTVLMVASEVVGFARTGGLADFAGYLPDALARRGHRCAVLTPLYRCTRSGGRPPTPLGLEFTVPVGDRPVTGRLWEARRPDSDVPVYLVEQPDYFDRDDPSQGRGLYHYTLPNGQRREYPDSCERWTFFCRAALEALRLLELRPDVLQLNDWQTGLVPVYLREAYRGRPGTERVRTLFTVHHIADQGLFPQGDMALTGLDWRLFNYKQLEFYGQLNFLKAGFVFADALTTVSPSHAREVLSPHVGCGLDGVLAERRDRLAGVVNGLDGRVWDPATDRSLAAHYGADDVTEGKPLCKAALQRRYGLAEESRAPLLGLVSRLVEQKGLNLVGKAADTLLHDGTQLVVLGEGDPAYHRLLLDLRHRYPERVGLTLGADEALAHQIEAGADASLMPSLFEPGGLKPLASLKYGTVPVARATGVLADTIIDCTPATLADGTANGFTFGPPTAAAFLDAVRRALALYRDRQADWLGLVRTGMRQDWSWDRTAGEYERIYLKLKDETV